MKPLNYVKWIACNAVVFAAIQFLDAPLRAGGNTTTFACMIIIKILAAIAIAYCCIAFCNKTIWRMGYPPLTLYTVLFCDALADIGAFIMLLSKVEVEGKSIVLISLVFLILYLTYGTLNSQIISPRRHVYTSEKLKKTYKFVFMSDLHYGSAQTERAVNNALMKIKDLKPDFLILGGDITDERTSSEDMKKIYKMIGSLGLDVFFVYGNHDLQKCGNYLKGATFSPEELEEAITSNGIKVLRDEVVQWSDDLVILGREDGDAKERRLKVDQLPERPDKAYTICIDHTPYIEDDILATGADLQLSGHTHAGQVFPLRYVYKLGVRNIYGEYKRGDTILYVSPGISGWYFPFRTEANCNYEVITLSPKTKRR